VPADRPTPHHERRREFGLLRERHVDVGQDHGLVRPDVTFPTIPTIVSEGVAVPGCPIVNVLAQWILARPILLRHFRADDHD